MRRILAFLFVCTLPLSLTLLAQEKEKPKEEMASMMPPKPLDNSFMMWMVGEWEGQTAGTMGKSKDWQKIDWSLDKQFVTANYSSKMVEVSPEQLKSMAASMKMSEDEVKKMMDRQYNGMGQFTINPMNGEFMGYWFDNWRGVYTGTGKIEGNKLTANWEGPRKSTRIMEKVSEDKMVESFKETDPSGMVMEGKSEWTRRKK